jgi:hypothetical protein
MQRCQVEKVIPNNFIHNKVPVSKNNFFFHIFTDHCQKFASRMTHPVCKLRKNLKKATACHSLDKSFWASVSSSAPFWLFSLSLHGLFVYTRNLVELLKEMLLPDEAVSRKNLKFLRHELIHLIRKDFILKLNKR